VITVPASSSPTPPILDERDRPPPPPLLTEKQLRPGPGLSIFIGLFAILSFVAIVWFSLDQNNIIGTKDGLPVVIADVTPIRVSPIEPGGMMIPHQDKLILKDLVDQDMSESVTERLIPALEIPIGNQSVKKKKNTNIGNNGIIINKEQKVEKKNDLAINTQKATHIKLAQKRVKPENPQDKKKTKLVVVKQSTNVTIKHYRIQLASVKSNSSAETVWRKYKKKYNPQLDNLKLNVERVSIKNKGVFYRVQGGPLGRTAAQQICKGLTRQKQPCIIVSVKKSNG
jgi:hypothetical protein